MCVGSKLGSTVEDTVSRLRDIQDAEHLVDHGVDEDRRRPIESQDAEWGRPGVGVHLRIPVQFSDVVVDPHLRTDG